jgi:MFS family permease
MLKKYFEPGALFSYAAYRNLWVSTVLTILAMSAFPIALAVTVLDAGGTVTTLGLILGARVLSGVLFSPLGGVVVDRFPRKKVLIAADGFRAIIGSVVVFHLAICAAVLVVPGVKKMKSNLPPYSSMGEQSQA